MNPVCEVVEHGSKRYDQCIALRLEVLRKPLGLEFSDEQLVAEQADIHLALVDSEQVIATLVLTPLHKATVKMRQVAVVDSMQGRGLGRKLVAFSEQVALARGLTEMTLNARMTAVPFYLALGYESVGDEFIEVSIPHLRMRKTLS